MLRENHVNRESKSLDISTFSYTYIMMNMKLLEVVTPPSIHQVYPHLEVGWYYWIMVALAGAFWLFHSLGDMLSTSCWFPGL